MATPEKLTAVERIVHRCESSDYQVAVTRVQTRCPIGIKFVAWRMEAFNREFSPFVTIEFNTKKEAIQYAVLGPRYW